ncbi:MAG TPA: spore maturation protein [Firmicutes bacterium]|nr:spore maturation protein [Bacillota bacterium]
MVSLIWGALILIGVVFSFFSGNLSLVNEEVLASSAQSLDMFLNMFPVIVLWMGLMQIASDSGLLEKIAHKFSFLLAKLFPSIPEGHESLGLIASNIIVNMVGLGSAATPFGLKAMEKLQELNKEKDTASEAMITFLVLNTSGVTLIPTGIISLRALYGSVNPSEIISTALIATICASVAGLLLDRFLRRKKK